MKAAIMLTYKYNTIPVTRKPQTSNSYS